MTSRTFRKSSDQPTVPGPLAPPVQAPEPPKPSAPIPERDEESGALVNTLTLDELMAAFKAKRSDHKYRPNRYYFSKLAICFLKAWFQEKGVPEDPNTPIYEDGDSEAGNAIEERIIHMLRSVYGYEGTVLKNIRFSEPVHFEVEGPDGKVSKATVFIIGRTDPIIIGDNFQFLDFFEIKSAKAWSKPKAYMENMLARKEIPLRLAQIESPDSEGAASINHLVQLAIGCKILRDRGLNPAKKRLLYVDRVNMNRNVSVLLTDAEVDYLYDLGVMWTQQHHANLQSDQPPAPQWFMKWECGYCAYDKRCATVCATTKQRRAVHPAMIGINERIAATNKSAPKPNGMGRTPK